MPTGLYKPGSQLPESMIKLAEQASAPVDLQERAPIYAKLMQEFIDNPTRLFIIRAPHSALAFADNVSSVSILPSIIGDTRGVAIAAKK